MLVRKLEKEEEATSQFSRPTLRTAPLALPCGPKFAHSGVVKGGREEAEERSPLSFCGFRPLISIPTSRIERRRRRRTERRAATILIEARGQPEHFWEKGEQKRIDTTWRRRRRSQCACEEVRTTTLFWNFASLEKKDGGGMGQEISRREGSQKSGEAIVFSGECESQWK